MTDNSFLKGKEDMEMKGPARKVLTQVCWFTSCLSLGKFNVHQKSFILRYWWGNFFQVDNLWNSKLGTLQLGQQMSVFLYECSELSVKQREIKTDYLVMHLINVYSSKVSLTKAPNITETFRSSQSPMCWSLGLQAVKNKGTFRRHGLGGGH